MEGLGGAQCREARGRPGARARGPVSRSKDDEHRGGARGRRSRRAAAAAAVPRASRNFRTKGAREWLARTGFGTCATDPAAQGRGRPHRRRRRRRSEA